jgi:hypothetical protein
MAVGVGIGMPSRAPSRTVRRAGSNRALPSPSGARFRASSAPVISPTVVLTAGGRQKELLVRGGEFESEITLDEGRNLIRVDTADASGGMAADMVEVIYSAPVDVPIARMDLVVKVGYDTARGSLSTSHKWAPHPFYRNSGQAAAPEFKSDVGAKGGAVSRYLYNRCRI